MVTLYVLQGPDKGRRFDLLDDEQVLLGRASELVPLTDLTVSRKHAMLEHRSNGWMLFEEGSSNGVFVNGVRINKQAKLKVGDQIRLGSSLLVFGSAAQSVVTVPGQLRVGPAANPSPGDSAIISTVSGNEDSIVLAAPEPNAAAMANFRVLLQMANTVGSMFDLDQLLNKVMDLVFENLRADRGFMALVDESTGKMVPKVVRYRDDEQVGKISMSQSIIQHVLSHNEGVLSSNAMNDTRFNKGKSVHNLEIRSAICVPIRGRDKNLGVLSIDTQVANFTYTMDQLRLVAAIGLQTGMAIENTRLYQEGLKRERLVATGETVASLSHSIKNILQGLRGGADVVERALRKDRLDEVKTGWDMVQRNLDKVHGLTMNMLAYSKTRIPSIEPTRLPLLIGEVIELIKPAVAEKHVTLQTDLAGSLPPVPLDADAMHQALLNLLGNAVEAVEPQTGLVNLKVRYDAARQNLVIEVTDNGHGIKQDDMRRIFEPFYSTKGHRGTGLGLAVTKKIIEEHGGSVEVESRVGQGTTFRLRVPMTNKALADPGETRGPR